MTKQKLKKGVHVTVHNRKSQGHKQSGVIRLRTKSRVQIQFKNKKLPKYLSKCFIHIDCIKLKKQKSKKKQKKAA